MQPANCLTALLLTCSLAACSQGSALQEDAAAQNGRNFTQDAEKPQSQVISTLLDRKSLLPDDTAYDTVAAAVLDASARSSQSELTSARLRAEAAAKNWLPTIGPSVSLTDLGDLVAGILIEQVLFDNGRRKAEREAAAADVELAAVNLSIDMNSRVETALALYVSGLRGDEKAALGGRALRRMQEFEQIVTGRVEGGIADKSDQRVVRDRVEGMRSLQATAREAAATARAELQAMTGREFDTTPTRLELATPPAEGQYLTVLQAQADAAKSVAQTKVDRAGLLPQVSAAGSATTDGSGAGLTLDTPVPLGLGTPALLKAIESARETANRRIGEAEEDSRRNYSRQIQRIASFRRQEAEAASLVRSSRETYALFQEQFEAGLRSVMDVIQIYEQLVQREEALVDAKYEVVLTQLALARDMGLLANGDEI